jgi:hypothetical protein
MKNQRLATIKPGGRCVFRGVECIKLNRRDALSPGAGPKSSIPSYKAVLVANVATGSIYVANRDDMVIQVPHRGIAA